MLIGAGERIITPHSRQPQPVLFIDSAVWLGVFALPLVLSLIVVERIRGLEDILHRSGSSPLAGSHGRPGQSQLY
jgi:hypothetical protein